MAAEHLIYFYLVAGLGVIGVLALFEEHRRRSFEPPRDLDQVFRCHECGQVYTDDAGVDRSRCPGCGRTNHPFGFR